MPPSAAATKRNKAAKDRFEGDWACFRLLMIDHPRCAENGKRDTLDRRHEIIVGEIVSPILDDMARITDRGPVTAEGRSDIHE